MDFYDTVDFDNLLDELAYFDQPSSLDGMNEISDLVLDVVDTQNSDASSTASSLSPVVFEHKEKKLSRKKKLQMYCYIPKIMKSDIRNAYPAMLANVLNTGDFALMFGFMDTFFVPNIVQVSKKSITNVAEPVLDHQSGKYDLAKYWYANLALAPDAIVQFSDSQVISYKGTPNCKIVTKLSLEMSHLYEEQANSKECSRILMESGKQDYGSAYSSDYTSSESSEDDSVSYVSSSDGVGRKRTIEAMNETAQKQAIMRNIMESVESMMGKLTLKQKPLSFTSVGTIAMYTNEHKMITKMELESNLTYKTQ